MEKVVSGVYKSSNASETGQETIMVATEDQQEATYVLSIGVKINVFG